MGVVDVRLNHVVRGTFVAADFASSNAFCAINLDGGTGEGIEIYNVEAAIEVNPADVANLQSLQIQIYKGATFTTALVAAFQLPSDSSIEFFFFSQRSGDKTITREYSYPLPLEKGFKYGILLLSNFAPAPANGFALSLMLGGRFLTRDEGSFFQPRK